MRRGGFSGFTLIELTVVLVLVTVLTGLVIVRMPLGGARQRVIAEARQLGNLIRTYRVKACFEETLYALRMDLPSGQYAFFKPKERDPKALEKEKPLRADRLPEALRFGPVTCQSKALASPVTVYFDAKGLVPEVRIPVHSGDVSVVLRVDPLMNEVAYDER